MDPNDAQRPDDEVPPDLMPAAFMSDEQRRKQPLGSPYAVPLTALVASAYVGITDQVELQPVDDGLPAVPATGFTAPADDGD